MHHTHISLFETHVVSFTWQAMYHWMEKFRTELIFQKNGRRSLGINACVPRKKFIIVSHFTLLWSMMLATTTTIIKTCTYVRGLNFIAHGCSHWIMEQLWLSGKTLTDHGFESCKGYLWRYDEQAFSHNCSFASKMSSSALAGLCRYSATSGLC